jgi:hypothetical protein
LHSRRYFRSVIGGCHFLLQPFERSAHETSLPHVTRASTEKAKLRGATPSSTEAEKEEEKGRRKEDKKKKEVNMGANAPASPVSSVLRRRLRGLQSAGETGEERGGG